MNANNTTLNLLVSCWQMRRSRVGPRVVLPWDPICSVTLVGLLEVWCFVVTFFRGPEKRGDHFALVNIHDAAAALPYRFGERRGNVVTLAETLQIIFNFLVVSDQKSHEARACGAQRRSSHDCRRAVALVLRLAPLRLIPDHALPSCTDTPSISQH